MAVALLLCIILQAVAQRGIFQSHIPRFSGSIIRSLNLRNAAPRRIRSRSLYAPTANKERDPLDFLSDNLEEPIPQNQDNINEKESSAQTGDFLVSNTYNKVRAYRCHDQEFLRNILQRWKYLPQVCVCGVSNAGKSSLINHLLKKDNIARASSVTGKTKSVDLFVVNDKFIIVDLPGFPGADGQASRLWAETFEPLVQIYLNEAADLRAMLFAHDARWPVTNEESKYLQAAKDLNLPTLVLLTKDDKVEHKARNWGLNRFRQDSGYEGRHIHYCSDNSLAPCRKARRMALKFIDTVCKSREKTL